KDQKGAVFQQYKGFHAQNISDPYFFTLCPRRGIRKKKAKYAQKEGGNRGNLKSGSKLRWRDPEDKVNGQSSGDPSNRSQNADPGELPPGVFHLPKGHGIDQCQGGRIQ